MKSLEELYTEVQGAITSPHLAMKLLYDVSWRRSLYLYKSVAMLDSEALEELGPQLLSNWRPFFCKWSVGTTCPHCYEGPRKNIILVRQGSSSRGGGEGLRGYKTGASRWGEARVKVCYDAHLPSLSLWEG